jgi:hypothetical protein
MVLGDSLTVTPANLTNGTSRLRFQRPNRLSESALALNFNSVSNSARVSTAPLADTSVLTAYGKVLNAGGFQVTPLLGTNAASFSADLRLAAGAAFQGNGQNLALLRQVETDWEDVPFSFDAASRSVVVPGVTNGSTFALIEVFPPRITITLGVDGFGEPLTTVGFAALPGWTYTLERTTNFVDWDEVASQTPLAAGWTALNDSDTAGAAFYRVRMNRP